MREEADFDLTGVNQASLMDDEIACEIELGEQFVGQHVADTLVTPRVFALLLHVQSHHLQRRFGTGEERVGGVSERSRVMIGGDHLMELEVTFEETVMRQHKRA